MWPLRGPLSLFEGEASQPASNLLAGLLGLLGQKNSLDVGQNTTLSDGDAREELVQLLVVADGELQVTGNDPALLVVTGGVSCQLENLSGEVLHDGSQVHGCAGANSLGVVALSQQTVDSADGELKPGTAGPALALSLCLSSFTTARHDCFRDVNTTVSKSRMSPKKCTARYL